MCGRRHSFKFYLKELSHFLTSEQFSVTVKFLREARKYIPRKKNHLATSRNTKVDNTADYSFPSPAQPWKPWMLSFSSSSQEFYKIIFKTKLSSLSTRKYKFHKGTSLIAHFIFSTCQSLVVPSYFKSYLLLAVR